VGSSRKRDDVVSENAGWASGVEGGAGMGERVETADEVRRGIERAREGPR